MISKLLCLLPVLAVLSSAIYTVGSAGATAAEPTTTATSKSGTNPTSVCNNVIVGAGWSGSYFAWRTSMVAGEKGTTLAMPAATCIFEAQKRVGGRAYSIEGVPGLQDMRVDLGAYRFDTHAHVLVNHVIQDVLKLPIRCYDARDQDPVCNTYGALNNVRDPYGNNAGYAHGPQGLVQKVVDAGGHLFLNHRLTSVTDSGNKDKPMRLTFAVTEANGATSQLTVDAARVFLNMPAKAIHALEKTSLLFTNATKETTAFLKLPREEPGAKQFLIYPNTLWRTQSALSEGVFVQSALTDPPLNGRYHDFYGKCPNPQSNTECFGAIMTYYGFDDAITRYYASYSASTAEPHTYIPLHGNPNVTQTSMIRRAHQQLMDQMAQTLADNKIDATKFNLTQIPEPTGTLLSVWWARDYASAINPAPSKIGFRKSDPIAADPAHRIRNRISKPLNAYEMYIANEAFSTGDGWAHPALIMTERLLYHFLHHKPSFVRHCKDCLTAMNMTQCEDCVSERWYHTVIEPDPPVFSTPQTGDGPADPVSDGCNAKGYGILGDERCNTAAGAAAPPAASKSTRPPLNPMNRCSPSYKTKDLELTWEWSEDLVPPTITVTAKLRAKHWAAFGFGTDMSKADIVVGFVPPIAVSGQPKLVPQQRFSTGHVQPVLNDSVAYVTNMSATGAADGWITLKFTRPAAVPINSTDNGVAVNMAALTPVVYATSDQAVTYPLKADGTPNFTADVVMRQHTIQQQLTLPLYCGYDAPVTFSEIRGLFRAKDRAAMLFQFDLYRYESVVENFEDIYGVLADKTLHGLATGMPPDVTWSVEQLAMLRRWNETDKRCGAACDADAAACQAVTFCKSIKPLFRAFDREAMKHMMDLWNYDDVKQFAPSILATTSSGKMPCDNAKWTPKMIQTFTDWVNCNMPKGQQSDCDTSAVTDSEVFYKIQNIESFPEFVPTARAQLNEYLRQAHDLGVHADPNNTDTWYRVPFNYTAAAFEERLDALYKSLIANADAPEADASTREKAVFRILQYAPFNLIDGAWINRCCPTGPIDELHSMLWGILNDEMGGGDVAKNHCQVYKELLQSLGLYLPAVNTKAFVDAKYWLPSAFTQAAYALVLSYFTQDYFPELLGTTLQLEWTVVSNKPTVTALERLGINPEFYTLHVGIDNAEAGHGWRAKRAVEIYLDGVLSRDGSAAMQVAWQRIWDGFLAFDGLGSLYGEMQDHFQQFPSPFDRVQKLMQSKAPYGAQNHEHKRLGNSTINSLFANTPAFIEALGSSAWVVPGNPSVSALMNYLTTPSGPMYKVFDDDDLDVWRTWILSLKSFVKQSGPLDSYTAMRHLVQRLMLTAMDVPDHTSIKIWGPSPQPRSSTNGVGNIDPEADENLIEQSVASWLSAGYVDPTHVMAALKHPKNNLIVCGNSTRSAFVTQKLNPNNPMGRMYERWAVESLDCVDDRHSTPLWSWYDIISRWIDDGCPMTPNGTCNLFPPAGYGPSASLSQNRLVHARAVKTIAESMTPSRQSARRFSPVSASFMAAGSDAASPASAAAAAQQTTGAPSHVKKHRSGRRYAH